MPLTSDPYFFRAAQLVLKHKTCTAALLQRRLGIGYVRAAELCTQLEKACVIGPWIRGAGHPVLADEAFLDSLEIAAHEST